MNIDHSLQQRRDNIEQAVQIASIMYGFLPRIEDQTAEMKRAIAAQIKASGILDDEIPEMDVMGLMLKKLNAAKTCFSLQRELSAEAFKGLTLDIWNEICMAHQIGDKQAVADRMTVRMSEAAWDLAKAEVAAKGL